MKPAKVQKPPPDAEGGETRIEGDAEGAGNAAAEGGEVPTEVP